MSKNKHTQVHVGSEGIGYFDEGCETDEREEAAERVQEPAWRHFFFFRRGVLSKCCHAHHRTVLITNIDPIVDHCRHTTSNKIIGLPSLTWNKTGTHSIPSYADEPGRKKIMILERSVKNEKGFLASFTHWESKTAPQENLFKLGIYIKGMQVQVNSRYDLRQTPF